MKKKTKIIVITAMVLLLGITGYLNIMLNNSIANEESSIVQTSSYFQTYRSTRESTRDQELLYYDAIITNENSTAEAIHKAENLKLDLINQMEQELVVEGLIKAKGFEDCIVSMLDGNVNAVVKAKELSSSEVAQILAVIQTQLSTSLENIKIIPVE